jgi:hypothetical protein
MASSLSFGGTDENPSRPAKRGIGHRLLCQIAERRAHHHHAQRTTDIGERAGEDAGDVRLLLGGEAIVIGGRRDTAGAQVRDRFPPASLVDARSLVNYREWNLSKRNRNVPVLSEIEMSPLKRDACGSCGKLFCSFPRSGGRVLFASTAPAASTGSLSVEHFPNRRTGYVPVLAPGMISRWASAPGGMACRRGRRP